MKREDYGCLIVYWYHFQQHFSYKVAVHLLVEETGVHEENLKLTTFVVKDTDA